MNLHKKLSAKTFTAYFPGEVEKYQYRSHSEKLRSYITNNLFAHAGDSSAHYHILEVIYPADAGLEKIRKQLIEAENNNILKKEYAEILMRGRIDTDYGSASNLTVRNTVNNAYLRIRSLIYRNVYYNIMMGSKDKPIYEDIYLEFYNSFKIKQLFRRILGI
jgi:hypothetical protein